MAGIGFDSPVASVFGRSVKKRDAVIKGLGIETVGELLRHHPRRYVETKEISTVEAPIVGEHLTVVGDVVASRVSSFSRAGRRQFRTEVRIRTHGPEFSLSFFAPYATMAENLAKEFTPGSRGIFTGQVKVFNGRWQLEKPHGQRIDAEAGAQMSMLVPVYPLTHGLYSWDLQKVIGTTLELVDEVPDLLGPELSAQFDLVDAATALRWTHAPDEWAQVTRAQQRHRFEEALVLQLVLARRRAATAAAGGAARPGAAGRLLDSFDSTLPFTLTAGQRRVGEEIAADMARPRAMNRLLQGEVGSGKTLVALRAVLQVLDSGAQAAFLAPTEVLAAQHHRSLTAQLGDLARGGTLGAPDHATRVALLTGSTPKAERRRILAELAAGEIGLLVGTHALLEPEVAFADLGLVVVDEQHRFGVEQRSALTDKAEQPPHVLVMTATPIPRTVAMTVFGDLETSVLDELPAGRAPIQTTVVALADHPGWFERVWQRVREEVEDGHQVYVVCPRISASVQEEGESDVVDVDDEGRATAPSQPLSAVMEVAEALTAGPLADLRVSPLHGRMSSEDKDRTMRAFAEGRIDVLVSTTVIEVGVDVHNATAIVLLDADRFGISQLHQLRGRVGRGGLPGLCLLVSHAEAGTPARERLDAVASTSDGFELSRIDLEQRREGDVLGANQSGVRSSLVTLRVLRDEATIERARAAAEELLASHPDLVPYPALAGAVAEVERSAASAYIEKG